MTKLFSNRVLITQEDAYSFKAALIEIDGPNIIRVDVDPLDIPPETQRFDDKIIIPAFINAHTHLPMSAFRGLASVLQQEGNVVEDVYFKLESKLSNEDIRAFTRLGALESLLQGVGFVWEHYYGGTALAEGLCDVGLEGVVAPTLQDVHGPGTVMLEEQLKATEALQSSKFSDRGIFAAIGPHATDSVSDGLWKELVQLAHETGLPLHFHLAQSWEEYERNQNTHGYSTVERLEELGVLSTRFLGVHGIFLSKSDLTRLSPQRHTLGFCPGSQVQFAFPGNFPSWTEAGIEWVVATDCGVSNDTMNVQQELRLIAGLGSLSTTWSHEHEAFRQENSLETAKRVLEKRSAIYTDFEQFRDPATLLRKITSIPGKLHPNVSIGELAVGHRASLLVLDPDHPAIWPAVDPIRALSYCDAAPSIESMMVGGEWVVDPSQDFQKTLMKLPEHQAFIQEARERRSKIFENLI